MFFDAVRNQQNTSSFDKIRTNGAKTSAFDSNIGAHIMEPFTKHTGIVAPLDKVNVEIRNN